MAANREIREGAQYQGVDEEIAYTLTTTPWGSAPGSVAVVLYDTTTPSAWVDVSDTNLSGGASVDGDVITTPVVTGLTAGKVYRCEIKFTCAGNVFEAYAYIRGQA